ncbi:unnamed protein product [Commensalibacter communis]|uniref:Uncharacterized protein n=1 Tax=Commensalibacter communis TaxID=2972786 RepID=A0A9W4TMV9_9PROT|nr:unnamed protein product [Commensalibacter communis]CAI3951278.1 unnamed protein product [Commensalibacter communis]CAI3951704.1 unnamed protein product [Commensalibacter communis]CAI3952855.1 unnamed protein product [Commensalibacter communis]CAI3952928.1 unnamed protein product [Commensalibacter communis]
MLQRMINLIVLYENIQKLRNMSSNTANAKKYTFWGRKMSKKHSANQSKLTASSDSMKNEGIEENPFAL